MKKMFGEPFKVGSSRKVTCLTRSPFCDGRVTFLAEITFLLMKTLGLANKAPPIRSR